MSDERMVIREWSLARTSTRLVSARLVEFAGAPGEWPRRAFELVSTRADGREYSTVLPLRALEDLAAACAEAREIVREG